MLKLASYDIVFTEIPGEVTLALNLAGCPNACDGCHSPHLREDTGEPLTDGLLDGLIDLYGSSVTCVCFMGGDGDTEKLERLARRIHEQGLKTAWYSGRETMPRDPSSFDYVKLGPYVAALGGLDSPGTNQRMYRIENGHAVDITCSMRKK